VSRQSVSISGLLERIATEISDLRTRLDVEYSHSVVPPDLSIVSDEAKLRVAVRNLVSNALKFTDQGRVRVRAAETDDGVEIRVVDTGIGIAAESVNVIFEPFQQVSQSATGERGGVGLGLYVTTRLVEAVGGRLSVESELGRGSSFRVWLPREPGRRPQPFHGESEAAARS